ncbi:MAG: peptidoglycan DD-metalloendopeptidase family protein, partial [Vicinamibacterales bacterium]
MPLFGNISPESVRLAALMSGLAYRDGTQSLESRLPAGWVSILPDLNLPLTNGYYEVSTSHWFSPDSTAAGFAAQNGDTLVIAFRGTEDQEIIADLIDQAEGVRTEQYEPLRDLVVGAVAYALQHDIANVLITGHSLGGQLAALAVADLCSLYPALTNRPAGWEVVTFASPGISLEDAAPITQSWRDGMLAIGHTEDPVYIYTWGDRERPGNDLRLDLPEVDGNQFSVEEHRHVYYDYDARLLAESELTTHARLSSATHAYIYSDAVEIINDEYQPGFHLLGGGGDVFTASLALPYFVDGGDGNDFLIGNSGDDELAGGQHNDNLRGGGGTDRLWGGDGADDLVGGDGADSLYGGSGPDMLFGGSGIDVLRGGIGSDTLQGGGDGDTLYGNADFGALNAEGDADVFVLRDADKATALLGGTVHIKDYNQGVTGGFYVFGGEGDRIDISQILTSTGGNLDAGQVRVIADSGGAYSLFQINTSGGASDWLTMARLHGISAGDTVSVQLSLSQVTAISVTGAPDTGGAGDGFDFPLGVVDAGGRRGATPTIDGDGYYVSNEFGEYYDVSASPLDYHLGEDWNFEVGDDTGAPVFSIGAGEVVFAGPGGTNWGNVVILSHPLVNGEHGGFVSSMYGHLGELSVVKGQLIGRGTQIGVVGAPEGTSTGAHLHFEIRSGENPDALKVGYGYSETPQPTGWIDPTNFIQLHRQSGIAPTLAAWTIEPASTTIAEGNASLTFTIRRASTESVETVYISTVMNRGSANEGDYAGWLNVAHTFAIGESTFDAHVAINDDVTYEGDETFGLIVQASSSDPASLYLAAASFTIDDEDSAPPPLPGESWTATAEDRSWSGTDGADSASGGSFDNVIRGRGGNDALYGGAGGDSIYGEEGDDTVSMSGADADVLSGGSGTDLLILARQDLTAPQDFAFQPGGDFTLSDGTSVTGFELIQFWSGSGDDRFVIAPVVAGTSSFAGGDGVDTAVVDYSMFDDAVTFQRTSINFANPRASINTALSAPGGAEHRVDFKEVERFEIAGGSGNDSLDTGSSGLLDGDDVLSGNGGDDELHGGVGADTLYGGAGNDYLNSGNPGVDAANSVYGGEGDDTVQATGDGADVLSGGSGIDFLSLSRQDLTTAQDVEFQPGGGFTLTDGASVTGFELIQFLSGSGDDRFVIAPVVSGTSSFAGGDGVDTAVVDYSMFDAAVTFQQTRLALSNPGNSVYTVLSAPGGVEHRVVFREVERFEIAGGSGNDSLNTDNFGQLPGDDVLRGNAGDDELRGGARSDTLYGGTGNDYLYGGSGAYYGWSSAHSIYGGEGDDTVSVSSGVGVDMLSGGSGIDFLSLSRQDLTTAQDVEFQPGGGFTLTDGTSVTGFELIQFWSGSGDDRFVIAPVVAGTSSFAGGDGVDTAVVDYSTFGEAVTFLLTAINSLNPGASRYTALSALGGLEHRIEFREVERFEIAGGSGNDRLDTGSGGLLSGDDALSGNGGNDSLYGGAGSDTLYGGTGNDRLEGGTGNDIAVFSGAWSTYTVLGSTASLTLIGPDGTDVISGVEQFQFDDRTLTAAEISNYPPVGVDDVNGADTVREGGANDATGDPSAAGNVLVNDTDADTPMGDTLSVAGVSSVSAGSSGALGTVLPGLYGSLTLHADGSWSYALDNSDPDTNALAAAAMAQDIFAYVVRDVQGATDTGNLTITISGANDTPVAVADTVEAAEDTAVGYSPSVLLANDTDVDAGTTLAIASVTAGTGGTVLLSAGTGVVVFTPTANLSSAASFTYTESDGTTTSAPATDTVNVAPVNDAPVT